MEDSQLQNQMLSDALLYRASGMSVIPVGPDKKPLVAWKEYQTRLPREDEIRGWWKNYPNAQIGIITGAISGIVVVDVEKCGNFDGYPHTPTAKTGGGGRHFYFKHPGKEIKNGVRVRELTDIRGDGGYVVAPPSTSEKGAYEWLIPPFATELAELPAWVLEEQEKISESGRIEQDWEAIFNGDALEGMRNDTATRVAGKLLQVMPPEAWPIGLTLLTAWNKEHAKPPLGIQELGRLWKNIARSEDLSRKQKKKETKLPQRERIAKVPVPEKTIMFDEWKNTITENFPDLLFAAETAMSVVAQFLIKDITNPFALVLVDVPSSGKTIAINFFDGIPELTYPTDKFSAASFVSNASNIAKEKLSEIDLLPRLQYRMFLIRDLAPLLAKDENSLTESLGTLTRVLDGEGLNTDTGVHGQRAYNGEYLFMILAGSTPIQPRVWKIMGNLGSRLFFLTINSRNKDEIELAKQIVDQAYKVKEKICREATKDFLYGLWNKYPKGVDWDKSGDDKNTLAIIARSAKLLARLRGVVNVWEDVKSSAFKYGTPVIEKPDRITQLFYNLTRGHALVSGRTQINADDIKGVIELCIDGAPTVRAKLFRTLIEYGGHLETSEVEVELNCSKPTALKEMKTLAILGVCTLSEFNVGTDYEITLAEDLKWFLGEECAEIRGLPVSSRKAADEAIKEF